MQNTAIAKIDLSALAHNLQVVRRLCPESRIVAMVKANAYGHGMEQAAGALRAADAFGVARLEEAWLLRRACIKHRILLLATLLDAADLAECSESQIDVVAHDETSVERIAAQARHTPLRVWLKLDSGMHRAGLSLEAFMIADGLLRRTPGVLELVHMTHFSSASDPCSPATASQLRKFDEAHAINPCAPMSVANSAALVSIPTTRAEWVRPGLMLYGDNPMDAPVLLDLRSAMTLMSFVTAIREISSGESVGYGGAWIATRPSRIATVGIGYGDGYPRHARNGTPVLINQHLTPIVGRVSMDSLTVDVTDCPGVRVGDAAVLWGAELPISKIARCADTISYELMTSLQRRVTRQYYL